jgi:hypothetical protein
MTLTDPAIYAGNGHAGAAQPLTDDAAKKPGAAANVRDAGVPQPPVGDASKEQTTTRRE